jgi:hypothetical protein
MLGQRQYRHCRGGRRDPRRHRQTSWINASSGIASVIVSAAIGQAARDKNIKAIVLRVDSPAARHASDQILHAVKKGADGRQAVVGQHGLGRGLGRVITFRSAPTRSWPSRHHHRFDRVLTRQGQLSARRWN